MTEEKRVIKHNGVDLIYYVSGNPNGEPILLMHGWGCSHQTVRSIAETLDTNFRIYTVDFPGFGESSEPNEVWGVDEYANCMEALMKKENLTRPHLVGHSFGGRVAIVLSSRQKSSKVMLIDSGGVKPHRTLSYYLKVYTYKLGKYLTNLIFSKEKARKIIEARAARSGSADYRNASPKMRAILSRVANQDLCDRMGLIKAPTLLIWGENDSATPLKDAKIMERLISDCGLVSFPGCGHYSFLDNPIQFRAVVRSFMNSK